MNCKSLLLMMDSNDELLLGDQILCDSSLEANQLKETLASFCTLQTSLENFPFNLSCPCDI